MTRTLGIDEIEEGMIVEKDVINNEKGVILITKNTIMTKDLISKLYTHGIRTVKITDGKKPYNYNEDFMESYARVEKRLDDLFRNTKAGNNIIVDEVVREMKNFAEEVSKERNVIGQLRLLHKKDDYTFNHSLAVSMLAISLGKWASYSKEQIFDLAIVGLFHDFGKLKISDDVINKPDKLTELEFDIIKRHSAYGYGMLQETGKFSQDVLLGVLQHHEKRDGTGYPNNLKGDEINKYARVVSICDVYHALISKRVYRDKGNPLKVADHIKDESFRTFDPYLSHLFLNNISRFYVGNRVLLSNGEIGTIIYIHPQDKSRVIVRVGKNFINFLNPQDVEIVEIII